MTAAVDSQERRTHSASLHALPATPQTPFDLPGARAMSVTSRPAPEHKLRASVAAGKYKLHRPGTAGAQRQTDATAAAATEPSVPHARVEYIGGFIKRRFQRSAAEERERQMFGRVNDNATTAASASAATPVPSSTAVAIAMPASPDVRPTSSGGGSTRSDSPGPPSFSRGASLSSTGAQRRISALQQKRESVLHSEDPWESESRYARAASIPAPLHSPDEPLSARTHIPPNVPLVLVPAEPPRLRDRAKSNGGGGALSARRIVEQRALQRRAAAAAAGSALAAASDPKLIEEQKEEHPARSSSSLRATHPHNGFVPAATPSSRSDDSDSASDSEEDELLEAHAAEAAMNARRSASPHRVASPSRLSPRVPPRLLPSTLSVAEITEHARMEQRTAHIRKLSITIAASPVLQPQQASAPVWPVGSPTAAATSAATPPSPQLAVAYGRLPPTAPSASSAPGSASARPPHARRPSVLGSVLEHAATVIPADTQHRSLPSSPCPETPATAASHASAVAVGVESPGREPRTASPPTPILKSSLAASTSPLLSAGGGGGSLNARITGASETLSPPSVASPHARGRSVSFSQQGPSVLAPITPSPPQPLPRSVTPDLPHGSDAIGPHSPAAAVSRPSSSTPVSAFSSPRLAASTAAVAPAVTALQSPTLFRRGSIEQVRRMIAGHIKTGIKPHSRPHSRSHSPYLSPRTMTTGDVSGEASGTSSPARSPSPLKLHPSSRQGSPQRRPLSEGSRASFLSLDAMSSPSTASPAAVASTPAVPADSTSELEDLAGPTTFVTAELPSHPLALQIAMLVSATSRRSSLVRIQKEDQERFISEVTQAHQQQQQQQQQQAAVVARAASVGATASLSPHLSPHLTPAGVSHARSKSAHSPPSAPRAPLQLSSRARGGSTVRTVVNEDAAASVEEKSEATAAVPVEAAATAPSPIDPPSSRRSSQRTSATRPLAQAPLPQHGRGRTASQPQLPAVDDLPGAADPRDLSFVPALGLTKPLVATLDAQKLFDGRFVQAAPLSVPVARPVSAVSASRGSPTVAADAVSLVSGKLRQASMEILRTSAAARAFAEIAEEAKQEREKEASEAAAVVTQEDALKQAQQQNRAPLDSPTTCIGGASSSADATLSSFLPVDAAFVDPLAPRQRSVSRPETPAFVVPPTPNGLPSLVLPLMPPSSFEAFTAKWGVGDDETGQRSDGRSDGAAGEALAPWSLPAGETTRRQQQRHAALVRAREIEGEDAEQRPLWLPAAHVLRASIHALTADHNSNVFTLKMESIAAAEAAARAEEEKRKQGLTSEEIESLTRVHVLQSESSILAPLTSPVHNRRASDVPSEYAEVAVSDEVRAAVAEAQDFAKERLRVQVEEQAAARAAERASLMLRPSADEQQQQRADAAACLNSFDLVSFRGARSFAAELRTLEDQRQEVRLDAEDSEEEEDDSASGHKRKRASVELFKPSPTWIDPSLPSAIAAVIAGGRSGLVRNLPVTAAQQAKVARKSVSFGSSHPTATTPNGASPLATASSSDQPAAALPAPLAVLDETATIERPTAAVPSSSPTVLYRTMEQRQQDQQAQRPSSSKRSSKQSSRASSRPQSARAPTPAAPAAAAAPAVPILALHAIPAHLYPPSMKESPAQQSARMDQARRFFEDDSEAVEAERAVLEAPHEALDEDALARLLGNGFQPFDPATQMVIDGRIMQRPFTSHWLSDGEQVANRMRRELNNIEFAARSTHKTQARTMASRAKIEQMARRPASAREIRTGRTRIDSPVPIEDDEEAAELGAATQKRPATATGVAAGFPSPLHAMMYYTSRKSSRELARLLRPGTEALPLTAAQRAQLQARLTQEEQARMDSFRRGEITALELEQQEAAAAAEAKRLRSKQLSPASSVWVSASTPLQNSHHQAARLSAANRWVPPRPQTARRPFPLTTATVATVMPTRPLSARPASAASSRSGTGTVGGGRAGAAVAAASLAHASRNLNDFVLRDSVQALLMAQEDEESCTSSRTGSRAPSKPQSASVSARRARALRPSSAATQPVAAAPTFIQPAAISSRLTASVVSALVHERPRSAAYSTLLDHALPVSELRAEECQREADEASRRKHHLQTNHLAIELAEQAARRARREERRIEAQRKQEALLETLVAEGKEVDADGKPKSLLRQSSGSKRALLAALTGSRKALHEAQQSNLIAANDGQAGTRGRRLTAMQRRVEIEKEFLLFAARPIDPRFAQIRAAMAAAKAAAAAALPSPHPAVPVVEQDSTNAQQAASVAAPVATSAAPVPLLVLPSELLSPPSEPLPGASPLLSVDVSSSDDPAAEIATFVVGSSGPSTPHDLAAADHASAAPAAAALQRRGSLVEQFGVGAVLREVTSPRRRTMEENAVAAAAEAAAAQQALIAEERSAASSCFVLLDAADLDVQGGVAGGGASAGVDLAADQVRLDELLVAEIESSPIWQQAVAHMLQEEAGYELPREMDRRIIALIAAGEHELTAVGSPPTLRPYLLDGVRCLRELASRRLESLYADDELMSMTMDAGGNEDESFGLGL